MITATVLANNIIRRSLEQKSPITPMKLQKLIYFVYRDYMQHTGKSLFSERFEVWKYGPVLPTVYHEFKHFKNGRITRFSKDSNGDSFFIKEEPGQLLARIIDDNWYRYKSFNGINLSQITHRPNTAWRRAYDRRELFLDDKDIMNDNER